MYKRQLFALPLYKAGMNPDSVLFFRYLFAIPVLGMMIVARGRSFKLKRKEVLPLIIMGLLVALSSLTLFQSLSLIHISINGCSKTAGRKLEILSSLKRFPMSRRMPLQDL